MPLRQAAICKKCEHFKNSFCRIDAPATINFYCYESIYCHSTGEYLDVVDVKDTTVFMMDNDETQETKRKRRLDDMKLNDELEVPDNCPYALEQVMEKQNA